MTRRTKIAIAATLFLLAYMFGIWWCWTPAHHVRPPVRQYTPQEKREIRKLLVHHGLQHEVSIIYGWPDNPYFWRDGRRCKFRKRG